MIFDLSKEKTKFKEPARVIPFGILKGCALSKSKSHFLQIFSIAGQSDKSTIYCSLIVTPPKNKQYNNKKIRMLTHLSVLTLHMADKRNQVTQHLFFKW